MELAIADTVEVPPLHFIGWAFAVIVTFSTFTEAAQGSAFWPEGWSVTVNPVPFGPTLTNWVFAPTAAIDVTVWPKFALDKSVKKAPEVLFVIVQVNVTPFEPGAWVAVIVMWSLGHATDFEAIIPLQDGTCAKEYCTANPVNKNSIKNTLMLRVNFLYSVCRTPWQDSLFVLNKFMIENF